MFYNYKSQDNDKSIFRLVVTSGGRKARGRRWGWVARWVHDDDRVLVLGLDWCVTCVNYNTGLCDLHNYHTYYFSFLNYYINKINKYKSLKK